jgi:hypothetical protein
MDMNIFFFSKFEYFMYFLVDQFDSIQLHIFGVDWSSSDNIAGCKQTCSVFECMHKKRNCLEQGLND